MSTFITNDFELLNVSYDNNEFNLLAKDQVGNLYRIREDLGDEDYVVESYKSVTSLDDSFSYYVDFDSSLYGVRGYSKDEDKDLDKDLFSFLSWVYSLTLDQETFLLHLLLMKSIPLLEDLLRTFFKLDVKVSSIENSDEFFNITLTGSESLFLEGHLNTTPVYSPDIADVLVFSIKDDSNRVYFIYEGRKVTLFLRECFDISLQKEKLTWDVMLYKD
jgi:hypothetical protein